MRSTKSYVLACSNWIWNSTILCLYAAPIIISEGGNVTNRSIINDFTDNDMLTLICTSDHMFDVAKWRMVNQTGTAQIQFTNTSNVSSTLTFTSASDNFTSYMRCISNNGIVCKDVFIIKGNKLIGQISFKMYVTGSSKRDHSWAGQ